MNYYGYIIYHKAKNGTDIVRHTKHFFLTYEEARNNAENWIKRNYPDELERNFEIYVKY